ncbi:MAG TPA: hypothetical protein VFJ82_04415 [Longimicrobium sp.]|nr:hypothetical protein [Longimicrobium sp.]
MKKLFPVPQSPNSPTASGGSVCCAASTSHSAVTSFITSSRSSFSVIAAVFPDGIASPLYPA